MFFKSDLHLVQRNCKVLYLELLQIHIASCVGVEKVGTANFTLI